MLTNYPIFAEYHYWIKKWLKKICSLPRLEAKNIDIPVVYTSPRRAFAEGSSGEAGGDAGGEHLYAPPSQGNNFLPVVFFRYTDADPILDRWIPFEHNLKRQIGTGANTIYKINKPMQVWKLSYTISMYFALQQDCDMLLYRLLTDFKPQCNLWIGEKHNQGDYTKGVYAHMNLVGVSDSSDWEPADINERVERKDINFVVDEAYVPYLEHKVEDHIVEDLYLGISTG